MKLSAVICATASLFSVSCLAESQKQAASTLNSADTSTRSPSHASVHKVDPALIQARAESEVSSSSDAEMHARARARAAARVRWGFSGNFQPQHYGAWLMDKDTWVFGNDKRIECEVCSYVLYMLIDRLGDQFSKTTIETEAKQMCPRVQWVMRSGCEFIVEKNLKIIQDLVMRLTEPIDMCKHINLCPLEPHDFMAQGVAGPYGSPAHAQYQFHMANNLAASPLTSHMNGMYPHMYPGMYGSNAAGPMGPLGVHSFYGYDQSGNPVGTGSGGAGAKKEGGESEGQSAE